MPETSAALRRASCSCWWLLLLVASLGAQELLGGYDVERLASSPIITSARFAEAGTPEDGGNICGPSLIRLPDWLPSEDRADPSARYYLYFAHHWGTSIRMAWAAERAGPYTLFNTGRFDAPEHPGDGVLDMQLGGTPERIDVIPPADPAQLQGVVLRGGDSPAHIASPEVLIDEQRRQFLLIFHGPTAWGPQLSFLATSADGLNFNMPADGGQPGHGIIGWPLAESYLALSWLGDRVFGIVGGGGMVQLEATAFEDFLDRRPELPQDRPPESLFTAIGNPFWRACRRAGRIEEWNSGLRPRHCFLRTLPDGLAFEVCFSRRGDSPEHLLLTHLRPFDGPRWIAGPSEQELLRSALPWEGVEYPVTPSKRGPATEVHQLRDPHLFLDDGRLFLLYAGAGEMAIGLAELTSPDQLPQGTTLTGTAAYHR